MRTDGRIYTCGRTNCIGNAIYRARDNIADISLNAAHFSSLFALQRDGTVITPWEDSEIASWDHIVSIAPGTENSGNILAVTADGHIKANHSDSSLDALSWENIAYATGSASDTGHTIVGITKDGYIKVSGNEDYSNLTNLRLFHNYMTIEAEHLQAAYEAKKQQLQAAYNAAEQRVQSLQKEISSLEQQEANAKGLFAGSRKKRLQSQIADRKSRLVEVETELQSCAEKLTALDASKPASPSTPPEQATPTPEAEETAGTTSDQTSDSTPAEEPVQEASTSAAEVEPAQDTSAASKAESTQETSTAASTEDPIQETSGTESKAVEKSPKPTYHVFADQDALKKISEEQKQKGLVVEPFEISLDLIHQAFHLSLHIDEQNVKTQDFYLFVRSELGHYNYDTPDLHIVTIDGKRPTLQMNRAFAGDTTAFFTACYTYMVTLNSYMYRQGLFTQYANMDVQNEGILLSLEGDEIHTKLVHGRERPSLLCTTLLGNQVMGRPYIDELMQSLKQEAMTFEEKLKEAEAGNVDQMLNISNAYLNGETDSDSEKPDFEKAFYWAQKAAECGDATAMYLTATYYTEGLGCSKRDFSIAVEWMQKAHEAGDPDATAALEKLKEAAGYQEKAEAGDPQAQAKYAEILMGLGNTASLVDGTEDFVESIQWARKAEGKDDGSADYVLALAYANGRGTTCDPAAAVEYYSKGAEIGHPVCLNNLGQMYMDGGGGLTQDKQRGYELILQAAQKGYPIAMYNTGVNYQLGRGTEYDLAKAVEWFEKYLSEIPNETLARKVLSLIHI